jgi:nicotinamidase-related amidase
MRGAILVITDMQEHFAEASDGRLLQNVCHLIDIAIAEGRPIAVLEWEGWGDTLAPIRLKLADYGAAFTVLKRSDGGAQDLLAACREQDLATGKWIVCGVSINACVKATVCGLAFSSGHPAVDVITCACADHFPPRWDEFPEASNVRLLPTLM